MNEPTPPDLEIQRRAFVLLFVAIGLFLFFGFLRPFAAILFVAGVVALLLDPLVGLLRTRARLGTTFAATAAIVLVHVAVLLPLLFVGKFAIQQLATVVRAGSVDLEHMRGWVATAEAWLTTRTGLEIDLLGQLAKASSTLAAFSGRVLQRVVGGTLWVLVEYLLVVVLVFWLLVRGRNLLQAALELTPLEPSTSARLVDRLARTCRAVVLGSLLTAVTQGLIAGTGLALAGVERVALLTLTLIFAAFIPVFGTALIWAPALISAAVEGRWGAAIVIGLFGGAASLVDNVIRPLFIQGAAAVSPLWVFLSIIGGIQVVGPVGVLLGPAVLALFVECVAIYRQDFLGLGRHLPVEPVADAAPSVVPTPDDPNASAVRSSVAQPSTEPPPVGAADSSTE